MKSPFPGMDPFLEQHWGDVHTRLMVYMCDQIDAQLPGDLQARVEESLMVDTEERTRTIYPDVRVVEHESPPGLAAAFSGAVAVAEPCVIPIPDEQATQRHIEIIDPNSGNRVVTAIEVLSPANKTTDTGRRLYREKQREFIQGGVNLVEIDLIRQGEFIVAVPEQVVPIDYLAQYIICIRRARRQTEAELIRVPLQEPLPNIRIPLRPTDADIVLQLQPLLDQCYRNGRYWTIDYSRSLKPRLNDEEQRWVTELLSTDSSS